MSLQFGGFSSAETMLSTLWIAVGTKAEFIVLQSRGLVHLIQIKPSTPYRVLTQAIERPKLSVSFYRARTTSSVRPPPPTSVPHVPAPAKPAGRVSIVDIEPEAESVIGPVTQLACREQHFVQIFVQLERSWSQDRFRPWNLELRFVGSPHFPRLITPRR